MRWRHAVTYDTPLWSGWRQFKVYQIYSCTQIIQRNHQHLIATVNSLHDDFFFSLLLNTSHWKTWVWATRNKVCVSTALAWRWTLRYTLCEGGRKGKGREKDGEQRVWPAKWISRSAEWQIKCQLTERTLAPDSLAPSTAQVVFVSRVHTHARHNTLSHSKCTNALQCNLNGWLLSALNRLISAGKTILFEFDKHSWSHIVNQYSTGKQEHKSYFLGGVRIFKILCVLSSAPYMT